MKEGNCWWLGHRKNGLFNDIYLRSFQRAHSVRSGSQIHRSQDILMPALPRCQIAADSFSQQLHTDPTVPGQGEGQGAPGTGGKEGTGTGGAVPPPPACRSWWSRIQWGRGGISGREAQERPGWVGWAQPPPGTPGGFVPSLPTAPAQVQSCRSRGKARPGLLKAWQQQENSTDKEMWDTLKTWDNHQKWTLRLLRDQPVVQSH